MAGRGFRKGDIVRVRDWAELADEWPADEDGDLLVGHLYFFKEMRRMCGEVSTVKDRIKLSPSYYSLILDDNLEDDELFGWQFPPECLEHYDDSQNAETVCEISPASLSGILLR